VPLLADDFGLYYNKTLFKKAGIKRPPRTISRRTRRS
jgi:multiple sugar transport system substrate-binding protein